MVVNVFFNLNRRTCWMLVGALFLFSWLALVVVQHRRMELVREPAIGRASQFAGDDGVGDSIPDWAQSLLRTDAERRQFARFAAARRAEERDVLSRMREILNEQQQKR